MGNCMKLKFNRRRLKMTQKEYAEYVGLSHKTICRLETDETAWAGMRADTVDKIYATFEPMKNYQPERPDKILKEINSDDNMDAAIAEEKKKENAVVVCEAVIKDEGLNTKDKKTLAMLTFLYDELNDVENHLEFVHTMKLINKIVSNY